MAADPSDVIVAPEIRDLDQLARQLTGWVASRMPEATDIALADLDYPRGAGQSHETILFDLTWAAAGQHHQQGWVVRIKPTSYLQFPDDLFEEQFALMSALHADGQVRVAKPMWFEPDPTLLGAPFFLMERKVGRVAVSVPPYREIGWLAQSTPKQRATVWENAVRELAKIPSVAIAELGFLKGICGVETGLEQEWAKYVGFVRWVEREAGHPWPALHEAMAALRASWPANQPEGLVWGDARLGNMMFGPDQEVVAVMDWEQPSLGGSLNDLAWFVHLGEMMHGAMGGQPRLEGMGTPEESIALWGELTGISTADIDWYVRFVALKIACLGIRTSQLKGYPEATDDEMRQRLGL